MRLLQKRRGVERKRMLRALDSKRYERLVERMTRTLTANPPRRGAGAGRTPSTMVAPMVIRGRFDHDSASRRADLRWRKVIQVGHGVVVVKLDRVKVQVHVHL